MNKAKEITLEPILDDPLDTAAIANHRPTKVQIRICIPSEYNSMPIISRLVSHHEVTVNITGASLEAGSNNDGWFDLELEGSNHQIQSALTYLDELDLEIINKTVPEEDGW